MIYREGRRLRALELRTLFQTSFSLSSTSPICRNDRPPLAAGNLEPLENMTCRGVVVCTCRSQSKHCGRGVVVKVGVEPNASRRVLAVSRDRLLHFKELYCYILRKFDLGLHACALLQYKPLKAAILRIGDSDGIVRSEY